MAKKAKSDYSEKLTSPKWQKKRLELMNLRGFKCEQCGCEDKELHVHHRFYIKGRQVWEYDNDVFQVLCCDCHEKTHKKQSLSKLPDNIPDTLIDAINSMPNELMDYLWLELIISKFNTNKELFIELIRILNQGDKDILQKTIYLLSENIKLKQIIIEQSINNR